jgi:hypothetical protein
MTPDETVDLLTVAAAFDQRTVGEGDVMAWYAVVFDLSYDDAKLAVMGHYTDTADRIMPAHVRQRVKAMRRDRLSREIVPAPDPEIADEPGRYRETLGAEIRRIADGHSVQKAIGGPVREDDPPPTWAEARAKMAPPRPPTPQEIALQQAAESRAAREAAESDEGEPAA